MQCHLLCILATNWVNVVAVGVPMGFIIILLVVILIVVLVRGSSGTESGENRAHEPNPGFEEVGLAPTSSKNQVATQDVPVQSTEYETTSPQATLDDHVYEELTKQMEPVCYENTLSVTMFN